MGDEKNHDRRGRPKLLDRERVLEVAVDSYWRDGIDGVSLNEICRRAGVSKPGIYREFGGQDGLVDAALSRYFDTVLEPAIAETREERPFRDVLAELVRFATDPDRGLPLGCMLGKTLMTAPPLGPLALARVESIHQTMLAAWRGWVEQAKQRGELDADLPVDVAASFVDAQMNNLQLQMATGEDPELLRGQARLAFVGLIGEPLEV